MILEQLSLTDILPDIIKSIKDEIHTTTIAKVTKVNPNTVNCKPVVKAVQKGTGKELEFPEFQQVPIIFLQSKNASLTYPIEAGDYVLLVICERCFDRWWSGSDDVPPPDYRVHDYSDAFAFPAINNKAAALPIPQDLEIKSNNNSNIKIESNQGATIITQQNLTANIGNTVTIQASGAITIASNGGTIALNADTVSVSNNLTVGGTVNSTGEVTGNGIALSTHIHGGVQTGAGTTGTPQ